MTQTIALNNTSDKSGLYKLEAFDNHELVVLASDNKAGLKAVIAIHNSKLGPTHGGTRMKVYESEDEAISDALELSRAMSYKSAMANLPYGGAKGVIILDGSDYDRTAVLTAYAKRIQQMHGLFRTGTDVGLTDDDTAAMAKHCEYILGMSTSDKAGLSTSKTAAKGVFYAMQAALEFRYGSADLRDRTVGVKGVGKLGGELVRLLRQAGATVLVADINPGNVEALVSEFPDLTVVGPDSIHQEKMDIYAPCALGHEFTPTVVQELACGLVVGGANNQLPDDEAGDSLFAKEVLYAPDYVVNAGGLIFVSEDLESDGFSAERVEARTQGIKKTLTEVFERSIKDNTPTHRTADIMAKERIDRGAA